MHKSKTKAKAIKTKEIIFSILVFWLVLLAISFFTSTNLKASETLNDTQISEGSFKIAKVIFPISQVSQNGKNVSLTINENARDLQNQSQNVDYSAMQKTGTNASKCPLVNSTAIDKEIKSYNPITGKAKLNVVFKTEEQAKKAADADCLLIKDTETE